MKLRSRIATRFEIFLLQQWSWLLIITSCFVIVSLADAKERSTLSKKSPARQLIPPPLEDLGKPYKVRLVYFVPTDKEAKSNYQEKAEVLMRVVADIYRREMKANGQKTRGLDFEFDEDGKLKVHLVKGTHPSVFYTGEPFNVDRLLNSQQQEIWEKTGYSRNRPTLCFSEAGAVAEAMPIPHVYSGFACVSGDIFRPEVTANTIEEQIQNFMDTTPVKKVGGTETRPRNKESQTSNGVLSHELGHIFGMLHDTRDPRNIMMRGYDNLGQMYDPKTAGKRPVRFSRAHARMAGTSRFFNESMNEQDTTPPEIHEFKLASPPKGGQNKIRISFKLSDDEGLGPLVVFQRGGGQIDAMVGDADLTGKKSYTKTVTLECLRPLLAGQPVIYIMNIFDKNGNLSQASMHATVVP